MLALGEISHLVSRENDQTIMNTTSLSNFFNNTEDIISNTLTNEDITIIKSEEGNVVVISEQQFLALLNAMRKSDVRNKL